MHAHAIEKELVKVRFFSRRFVGLVANFNLQFVESSSYGTLERLANDIVKTLSSRKPLVGFCKEDSWIRVRIEKPVAVPFADAPSIEVYRPIVGVAN